MNKIFKSAALVFSFLLWVSLNGVFAQAALTLDKAVDVPVAPSGTEVVYTIDIGCSSLTTHCVGAILTDTLPPELEYNGGGTIIVQSMGMPVPIVPTYDAVNHTLTWDFTVLPEGGMPAGTSANFMISGMVYPGIVPNGTIMSNTVVFQSNDDLKTDTANTTVTASPQWSLTKSLTSSRALYHDDNLSYRIRLCPGTQIGNLNLDTVIVVDTLPAGAEFVSATGGGMFNAVDSTITWNLGNLSIEDGCTPYYYVTIKFPAGHPDNDTGFNPGSPISKENVIGMTSDPIGEPDPYILGAGVSKSLQPPFFGSGIIKEAADDGILPVSAINYFEINATNSSSLGLIDFTVLDTLPAQFDLVRLYSAARPGNVTYDLQLEFNKSGVFNTWHSDVDVSTSQIFEATTIMDSFPAYNPTTDWVSGIKWIYGDVPRGFTNELRVVVEAAHPTANDGTMTEYAGYINGVFLDANNSLDSTMIPQAYAYDSMCIVPGLARMEPVKSHEINYIDPPAGAVTTGNPFFQGARVKYHLSIGNDGIDDVDTVYVTSPQAFQDLVNPIASDLLPIDMIYEEGSWEIVANTTGIPMDTMGTNPVFEKIDDFNGTGRTLLRWYFTGNFKRDSFVNIDFNATIRENAIAGTDVVNSVCITAVSQDFICEDEECGMTDTTLTNLRNYYGTTLDPMVVIPGVVEMCCKSTEFTIADTTAIPEPEKVLLSTGSFAPQGTDLVETGQATDTLIYTTTLNNDLMANSTLPDPVGMDLLPEQLRYAPGSYEIIENTTGLTLSNDGSNPTFEVIEDYNGTGRTLLRWSYSGEFPIGSKVTVKFKTVIKTGAAGSVRNDFASGTDERFYNCINGSVPDTDDMDGDGDVLEDLCLASSITAQIQTVTNLAAKLLVRGTCDDGRFHDIQSNARAYMGDTVQYRLYVTNPGNVNLTNVSVVNIFPWIGDMGVKLNDQARESGWAPILTSPITTMPNTTLYYSQSTNPCRPEMDPTGGNSGCVNDWTTTAPGDLSLVKAIKVELNMDLNPTDSLYFDIYMTAPSGSFALDGGTAWNSIARKADQLAGAQEPNKVGVDLCLFDLALKKVLDEGQATEFEVGDDIDFTITVYNQGAGIADSIEITDYIPVEMGLNDADWTSAGRYATKLLTVADGDLPMGGLPFGDSVEVSITLQLNAYPASGEVIENWAEISSAREFGIDVIPPDFDSQPDDDFNNDIFGADNELTGNGLNGGDEDDMDLALVPTKPQDYDYGDLPDNGAGTGTGDYETLDANTGPSHLIRPGILLGATVDFELDGQPNSTATGDGADEDGIDFRQTMDVVAGGVLKLPLSATNTTGNTGHVEAWIDWNGDGDFDDPGEMVADFDDTSGSFPEYIMLMIPDDVVKDQAFGFRVRLSNEDNMTPYGQVDSGEVEDYMMTITCPTSVCKRVTINKN